MNYKKVTDRYVPVCGLIYMPETPEIFNRLCCECLRAWGCSLASHAGLYRAIELWPLGITQGHYEPINNMLSSFTEGSIKAHYRASRVTMQKQAIKYAVWSRWKIQIYQPQVAYYIIQDSWRLMNRHTYNIQLKCVRAIPTQTRSRNRHSHNLLTFE